MGSREAGGACRLTHTGPTPALLQARLASSDSLGSAASDITSEGAAAAAGSLVPAGKGALTAAPGPGQASGRPAVGEAEEEYAEGRPSKVPRLDQQA